MVIGEENAGKTTALHALMADLRRKAADPMDCSCCLNGEDLTMLKTSESIRTEGILQIGEIDITLKSPDGKTQTHIFTFLDTAGYGATIDLMTNVAPIEEYIKDKMEKYEKLSDPKQSQYLDLAVERVKQGNYDSKYIIPKCPQKVFFHFRVFASSLF